MIATAREESEGKQDLSALFLLPFSASAGFLQVFGASQMATYSASHTLIVPAASFPRTPIHLASSCLPP